MAPPREIKALILALPDSAGSAIYGLVDVFASTGTLWQQVTGSGAARQMIRPLIVSPALDPFTCGNGIPVRPDTTLDSATDEDFIVVPELWLAPDDALEGRYNAVKDWLRRRHRAGCTIYAACSGSVLLAAAGLLDGRPATSHWAYADLFRRRFPAVQFIAEPNVLFGDEDGRIVTAGGATNWHDLAIHIISRHCSPGDALHIAKTYMLQWHREGQLPYASLLRRQPHADAAVRTAEDWLRDHFTEPQPITTAIAQSGLPERSLSRRFKRATGASMIGYLQNLRIEEAKRLLEFEDIPTESIGPRVGYENQAFFRRLFKRATGLTTAQYRRTFQAIARGQARTGAAAE